MKFDYKLIHIINNYKTNGVAQYEYVGSTMWFSNQELCDEVSNFLGFYVPINTEMSVTKEQLQSVNRLLNNRKDLIGMYGNEFLND